MSADNGVYMLKMKDQIRVITAQAIDNISYSIIDGNLGRIFNPAEVVRYFGNQKYTRDYDKACKVAQSILNSLPICEYGICEFTFNKTWKHIMEDAKREAEREIKYITDNKLESKWRFIKDIDKRIINGYYK